MLGKIEHYMWIETGSGCGAVELSYMRWWEKFSFIRSHLDRILKRMRWQGLQWSERRTIQVEGICSRCKSPMVGICYIFSRFSKDASGWIRVSKKNNDERWTWRSTVGRDNSSHRKTSGFSLRWEATGRFWAEGWHDLIHFFEASVNCSVKKWL